MTQQTIDKKITDLQLPALNEFANKAVNLGAELYAFDNNAETFMLMTSDDANPKTQQAAEFAKSILSEYNASLKNDENNTHESDSLISDNRWLGTAIPAAKSASTTDESIDKDQPLAVVVLHITDLTADKNSHATEFFSEFLRTYKNTLEANRKNQLQIELITNELSQTYEELVLLYKMSTNMLVTETNATYLQMACDKLTELVSVEGIAIFVKKEFEGHRQLMLTAGSGMVTTDPAMIDMLEDRVFNEMSTGKDVLLDSQVDSPFKYSWPENVNNVLAVPLQRDEKIFGIMLATNRLEKPDFDSIDAKLFISVANQCAVFIENERLFGDLKELFVGSLKALTNSIDAKDQYTRGHSERVAFISRWIAERYAQQHQLSQDQIHCIYLAGLLHDIGKIGINELVLQKKGGLSDKEHAQIKAHPRIGASILSDIKQMKNVVPAVLYHHEKVDGSGYPDGLKGDQIPLTAKIISIADSFDAMTSKRIYRDAMSIKRALNEIKKGLGTQFDHKVGTVFIESDIQKLWSIIHDGFIERWDYSNFSEYGTTAVGTLIK
jgi:HD-GYP domain-containing protein (c-di-GMP phosphodiesterase class II)